MKRLLSYFLALLVVVLLAVSMFAPAPGARIVQPEKNDCTVLQRHYQGCITTHAPDTAPCEEITALWLKCLKNQRTAGTVR